MVAEGLTDKVTTDKSVSFYFFRYDIIPSCFYEYSYKARFINTIFNFQINKFCSCGTIPPPVIMVQKVSFRYSDTTPWIYKDLEFGMDLDTRLALVGPNGAGKSTLLKLIAGEV